MSFHLLFTGKAVGLGTLQSTQDHFVLSQRSLLNIENGGPYVNVPLNELLPIMNYDTFIEEGGLFFSEYASCKIYVNHLKFVSSTVNIIEKYWR